MYISTHSIHGTHPVDTAWVDEALATAHAGGDPLGTLIGRPLGDGDGDGIMLTGWPDAGEGRFALVDALRGRGTAQVRFMQVLAFDGPRSAQWAAAEDLAGRRRLWPATQGVPGVVWVLRLRTGDNAVIIVTLTETADAIDEAVRAVMSSTLLPEEDPALLAGPDRVGVYRLMHADLPIEATDTEGIRA